MLFGTELVSCCDVARAMALRATKLLIFCSDELLGEQPCCSAAPGDVVNRVLDPVRGHVQIPANVGCSSRFAAELAVDRAGLRVALKKHVQALE